MVLESCMWRPGLGAALLGTLFAFERPSMNTRRGVQRRRHIIAFGLAAENRMGVRPVNLPARHNDGYRGRFDGDWHNGLSLWTQDYPRADRDFSLAVRRLTRIQTRSVSK